MKDYFAAWKNMAVEVGIPGSLETHHSTAVANFIDASKTTERETAKKTGPLSIRSASQATMHLAAVSAVLILRTVPI